MAQPIAATASRESSVLPGADISGNDISFIYALPDNTACKNACLKRLDCWAWTFAPPGLVAPQSKCMLKSRAGPITWPTSSLSALSSGVVSNLYYASRQSSVLPGADIPGNDIFTINSLSDSTACRNSCLNALDCWAWTYAPAGLATPESRCILKSVAGPIQWPTSANRVLVSGTVSEAYVTRQSSVLPGADIPGNDISTINLLPDSTACRDKCLNSPSCLAWTYAPTGLIAPESKCLLKSAVSPTTFWPASKALVSGSVFAAYGSRQSSILPGADIPGNDIFVTNALPDKTACKHACIKRVDCWAWTYAPPGLIEANSKCILKSKGGKITWPTTKLIALTSGVVSDVYAPRQSSVLSGADVAATENTDVINALPDKTACQNACLNNVQCVAWTYALPGLIEPNSKCILKSKADYIAPQSSIGSALWSGVVSEMYGYGSRQSSILLGADIGNDLANNDNLTLGLANMTACRNACLNNPGCNAWTYARAGLVAPASHCYLKAKLGAITWPTSALRALVSGVVSKAYPGQPLTIDLAARREGVSGEPMGLAGGALPSLLAVLLLLLAAVAAFVVRRISPAADLSAAADAESPGPCHSEGDTADDGLHQNFDH